MPKHEINEPFVLTVSCAEGLKKQDFFDTLLPGFMLEVRASGGKTYYLRYRNKRNHIRQLRIASSSRISLKQARQLAREALLRVAQGEDPVAQRQSERCCPTFDAFVHERYMPFIKQSKRSWRTDESLIRLYLLPQWGPLYLDEIKPHTIIALHHARRQQGAAASSANRILIIVRYLYNLAIKWNIPGVMDNPAAGIPLFEENNHKERFLVPAEAERLYAALLQSKNPMLRFIVPMLILTGARKSEVQQAQWSDFDFSARSWRIPLSKSGKARHVPITEGLAKLLSTVPRYSGCPWVFPNPDTHKPYTNLFKVWNDVRCKANLPDLRIHDLRHSFASFLVNNGRSLYEVQQLLGHSHMRTTQRYAHLSNQTLLDAADVAVQSLSHAFPLFTGDG